MDRSSVTRCCPRRRRHQGAWRALPLLSWVSLSLTVVSWTIHPSDGAGIQSGPSIANSYAGGMYYNAKENMVYVTGQTYGDELTESTTATTGSNCFVAVIDMDTWEWDDEAVLSGTSETAISACQAVAFMSPSYLVVGGISEKGGPSYSGSEVMVGFAGLLDITEYISSVNSVVLVPTRAGRVEYPQFLVVQAHNIFAISLTSIDSTPTDTTTEYPDYMTHFKYGTSFYMTIRKWFFSREEFLGVPTGPASLDSEWVHEFPIEVAQDSTPARVYVGGVLAKNDKFLIVAGSTRGQGVGYGPSGGTDEDGFITLLDLTTGELYQDLNSDDPSSSNVVITTNNVRIGTEADDAVMGACDDPTDPTSFYIVGATAGKMDPNDTALPPAKGSLSGFISKVSLGSLTTVWSKQWGSRKVGASSTIATPTSTYAVDCAVIGSTIYVTGGVENGAGIIVDQQTLASNGGSDIWVASLQSDTGNTNWVKQVGTNKNDELARHGGIAIDNYGNAILCGSTTGSFFRQSDNDAVDTSDIFVMVMDAVDGNQGPLGQPVAAPTVPPLEPTLAPVPLPTLPPAEYVPVGDQLNGPIYAGAMVYDARNNKAWLTGATYLQSQDSQCFVASVDMATGKILAPTELGQPGTNEACMAMDFSQLENMVYLASGTQPKGYLVDNPTLNPQDDFANKDTVEFGLVLQVDVTTSQVVGAGINQNDIVQYPVAMIADPHSDVVFVASMSSDNGTPSKTTPTGDTPNFTTGGIRPYGSAFFTVIQRYRVLSTNSDNEMAVQPVLQEDDYQWFGVDEAGESVFTTGMILAGDGNTLVVVGSTRGTSADGPFGTENAAGDMDGFIMKLDPATLELMETNGYRSYTRLDSINQKDDWVTNICNDRYNQDAFYVVGASQGKIRDLADDQQPPEGTTHAFIAKINLETLTALWLKHFTMTPTNSSTLAEASAYGCAVTSDPNGRNLIYVAGVIQDGATMDGAQRTPKSALDDLFVAQLNGDDGTVNWIHQIGTPQNERLAHGGGVDVDQYGNAIVFGETAGNFYSKRSSSAPSTQMDLVVFTMNKEDGSYREVGDDESTAPPTPTPDPDRLPDNIAALQTGPDVGPTYAGGMFYDAFTNAIYVTGATFGAFHGPGVQASDYSMCIFGVVALPQLEWREKKIYGNENVDQACNAISVTSIDGKASAVIVGSTEANGLLTQLGSGNEAKQYGVALDLATIDSKFQLQGGALMDQNMVQFPVAVEANQDGVVWIVSMISNDAKVSASDDKTSTIEYPNLTAGGIHKYGSKFRIAIERYELIRAGSADADSILQTTLQQTWWKPFETADQESIFLSDMIQVKGSGTLVVVGSTRGAKSGADMDGIMAKIDPQDGKFQSEGKGSRSVGYFASVSGRDDWILGACADPDDDNYFYVVGATQGKMDSDMERNKKDVTVHAVVAKMHVESLSAVWTKQFSVTHADGTDSLGAATSFFGCDVINGAGFLYVAGNVENGATIDYESQTSAGRDDIVVAKLSTSDGNVAWLKQVGSNGDDRVAFSGGVKVDANGNAVVFGDTNGSFFRDRTLDGPTEHYADLFVLIFHQDDGSHMEPLVAPPIDMLPPDTSVPEEWYPNGVTTDRSTVKTMSFGIIALLLLVVVSFCFCFSRRQVRKRAEAHKMSIFAYLQQFDVEDIDLRKSPPGGWHGTHLNKLAYGINKAEMGGPSRMYESGLVNEPYKTAPLTHSSVVRDSLFMDTASTPSLGYRDDPEQHGLGGYDDLRPRTH